MKDRLRSPVTNLSTEKSHFSRLLAGAPFLRPQSRTRAAATTTTMIKGIMIVNNHGKPRIVKFYEHVPDAEQQAVIRDIYTQVSKRPDTLCNFLEGTVRYWGDGVKLIYRHYATLYFVFAVDQQESDLGILDLIQVFVETLDKIFENVCELDLIFHSDKVHYALDEIVMGGMVLETNINEILTAVNEMNRLDTNSTKRALPGTSKRP